MTRLVRKLEWLLAVFVAAAALFGGADLSEPHLRQFFPNIPAYVFTATLLLAIIFTILSLMAACIWISIKLIIRYMKRPAIRYEFHCGAYEDLPSIHKLAVSAISADMSESTDDAKCIRKNKDSFTTIRQSRIFANGKVRSTFMGYYGALPLTEAATRDVLSGLLTGLNMDDRHIVKYGERETAIYIGGIAGKNEIAKGLLMFHLKNKIIKAQKDGVQVALARGVTEIGRKRLEENGFYKIIEGDAPLYRRDLQSSGNAAEDEIIRL